MRIITIAAINVTAAIAGGLLTMGAIVGTLEDQVNVRRMLWIGGMTGFGAGAIGTLALITSGAGKPQAKEELTPLDAATLQLNRKDLPPEVALRLTDSVARIMEAQAAKAVAGISTIEPTTDQKNS